MDEDFDWGRHYRHPTDWNQRFEPLSLPGMLARSAARAPDAPLIDFYGRKFSYAQVEAAAARFCGGLRKMGIGRGDRVALFLPNVPHYIAAYFGILRLGAVVVNLSPLYSVEELQQQIIDSSPRAMVTLDARALLPNALAAIGGTSVEHLIVGSIAGALPPAKSMLYRLFSRHDIAPRPQDARLGRSEGHTSELQSLMRSSYAVFCLKKKTNK